MRLVFAGTPAAALPSLIALLDAPQHDVVAVITRPDAPSGRGRRVAPSPVAELAALRGLPVLKPAKPRAAEFVAELDALQPECCPLVAFGALITPAMLAIPRFGWVNLHFSLLPAWRGAAPVQAAIRHGDEITGATTFQLDEGWDSGPTFGVVTDEIRPRDTAGELLDRLARAGAPLMVSTVDGLEDGTVVARPQPADGVSYAPKVTVEDAHVDWATPTLAVDRLVRSVAPEPGAWSVFRGERLGLGPVLPSDVDDLKAGELRAEKRRVLVGTATTAVELGEVRGQGRRPMPAADWARGSRVEPGELLT